MAIPWNAKSPTLWDWLSARTKTNSLAPRPGLEPGTYGLTVEGSRFLMARSAKNSNGFFGPRIGRFPAPNLCRTWLGSLSSLRVGKSNRINGVGWYCAELLPNSGGLERRTSGLGCSVPGGVRACCRWLNRTEQPINRKPTAFAHGLRLS